MIWNKIPESRRCLNCKSPYTLIASDGYARWHSYQGGFLCSNCYSRVLRYEAAKIRNKSTMEMAEILPVSSDRRLGELWP